MISGDPRLPQLSGEESKEKYLLVSFYRRFQERFYTLWREFTREIGDKINAASQLPANAVEGAASSTDNIVPRFDGTTGKKLQTSLMLITDVGQVGINNTSPESADATARDLVVGNGASDRGITIYSGNANYGSVLFADGFGSADAYRGVLEYVHTDNRMGLWTNAVERARIDSSGTLTLRQSSNASNVSVSLNTTAQNALTLDSSGNLGVGAAPSGTYKLEVNGLVSGTALRSSVATGTAPLTVASTTAVTNLNADLLDGNHASAFAAASHTHSTSDITSGTFDNARINWAAPGTIGSTTPNTGAFTTLSSTQGTNLATSSGNVGVGTSSPATKLHLQDGGLYINPTTSVYTNPLNASYSPSSFTAAAAVYSQFLTVEDNVAVNLAGSPPTAAMTNLYSYYSFGGTSTTKFRHAIQAQLLLSSKTGNTAAGSGQYVAVTGVATADANDNGTGTSGTNSRGQVFGGNFNVQLTGNATYYYNATAAEFNTECKTGSSVWYKSGIQIAQQVDDKVAGSAFDAAISLSNVTGASGWKNGLLFNYANGTDPMLSTGKLIATTASNPGTTAADYGIYFEDYKYNEWIALIRNRGTASTNNGVYIRLDGTNNANRILVANANGTDAFYVAGDKSAYFGGNVSLHTTSVSVGYLNTDGGAGFEDAGTNGTSFFLSRKDNVPLYINTNGDRTLVSCRRSGTEVGTISVTTTATAYNTSSDYRLKESVEPMTGALAKIAQLSPCTFTWKSTQEPGQGFIAHELQAVFPDAVNGQKDAVDEDGNPVYQGVDTSFLVATLVKAVQEQQAQIESLQQQVAALQP